MDDISSSEGQDLFDKVQDQPEQVLQKYQQSENEESHAGKRLKKHKKDKKLKKKRHRQYEYDDEEDDYDNGMGDYFEEQASQHSDEEQDYGQDQLDYNAEERRRFQRQLYTRKRPQQSEVMMNRIKGKTEKEINQMYKKKLYQDRENEVLVPSSQDHQTYSIQVKPGKQQQLVFSILKKTQYYRKTHNPKFKIQITSAMCMKKKYPGKIFIEAANDKDIYFGLNGFIDANLKKITKLEHQDYTNLFVIKQTEQVKFRQGDYIRIAKGLYQDDLGKIVKMNKNTANVMLVPRINIQEMSIKIKEQISQMSDEKKIQEKKLQMLKKFLNPRMYYPAHLRPPKKLFDKENPFEQFSDLRYATRIQIQKGGLIVLNFRYDELKHITGSVLPIEMKPFAQDGRAYEELKGQKVVTMVSFEKGQEAEIIAGQLMGYFGTIVEIKENTAKIKCRTKGMEGTMLEQPLEHLAKRFKEGERVKVISGTDRGKTGIILKLQGRHAQIWTDNQNSITINKNNLQRSSGQLINEQNIHNLKKDDLIKTSKNLIGIVLSTTKDNIKILDMNNTIQIINNLDFDTKINSSILQTKNKNNQQIRNNSIVRIKNGLLEGLRCIVKHVYKDYVFLFNQSLDRTSGMTVERADNCAVLARTSDGRRPRKNINQNTNANTLKPNAMMQEQSKEEEFKVGKSIVISTGPLKGYRGVIKSINKDKIQVRVPQKATTEWITRGNLVSSSKDNMQLGKTPRRMGVSTYQQPAMSPNSYYHG